MLDIIPKACYTIYEVLTERIFAVDIITTKEAAEKWELTERRVREMIRQGKIAGTYKIGTAWVMPADTQKPPDARITHGKNVGKYRNRKAKIQSKERSASSDEK